MKTRKRKLKVIVLGEPNREDCSKCNFGKGMEVLAREILEDVYYACSDMIDDMEAIDETIEKIDSLIEDGNEERALELIYLLSLVSDYRSRVKIEAFISRSEENVSCFLNKFAEAICEFYYDEPEEE